MKDTDICKNCFQEFANHNYVKDSIDKYECPFKKEEHIYGFFHGGDPNDFHPDYEACSDAEIEAHKNACAEGKDVECGCKWVGNTHVSKSPFGLGVNVTRFTTYFELLDHDYIPVNGGFR